MKLLKRLASKLRHIVAELRLTQSKRNQVLLNHRQAFKDLGICFDAASSRVHAVFNSLGVERRDTSMHYELFAGFSETQDVGNILEIGTAGGYFTHYLAALFPDATIETWDLPASTLTNSTVEAYNRISEGYGLQPESSRQFLDSLKNVVQIQQDSTRLAFKSGSFDLVWVDGDHTFPVVAFDVINALRMTKPSGRICIDDIRLRESRRAILGSQETFKTVRHLEGSGLVSLQLVMKRIDTSSMLKDPGSRKYIAVIQLIAGDSAQI